MNMEDQIREAMTAELQRQAEAGENGLKVSGGGEERLRVEGQVDMDALAMAVAGSLAGGP